MSSVSTFRGNIEDAVNSHLNTHGIQDTNFPLLAKLTSTNMAGDSAKLAGRIVRAIVSEASDSPPMDKVEQAILYLQDLPNDALDRNEDVMHDLAQIINGGGIQLSESGRANANGIIRRSDRKSGALKKDSPNEE